MSYPGVVSYDEPACQVKRALDAILTFVPTSAPHHLSSNRFKRKHLVGGNSVMTRWKANNLAVFIAFRSTRGFSQPLPPR
ncbi:hypothetical protein ACTMU2_37260 [Cupriavidus basilensis]